MTEQPKAGLGRREFLRRAAITGAVAWSAPVVSTIRTPALAQTVSPRFKDFSYVALCYTCDGGLSRCCLKFDLDDDGFPMACEEDNFQTPKCTFPFDDIDNNCADCGLFDVSSPDSGQTIFVSFKPSAPIGCQFVLGQGVGKCGNPPVNGDCEPAILSLDGRSATFVMCG